MATTYWTGNGMNVAQVESATVTAVAASAPLTATLNGKTVTYTMSGTDTTSTAAAAFQALLSASSILEFGEITFTVSTNVVTATASNPGTPFAGMTGGLVFTAAGGAAVTQASVTANVSQSDPGNANNWLRAGVASLPQNGDDVIVADSSIPIKWNLSALAAVQFASYTRYQSYVGSIGLPQNNPNGYTEWRQKYFQFIGSGTLTMTLGFGAGGGPSGERYDVGAQRITANILASGSSSDDFAVRILGTNAANVLNVLGTTVGVAMLPAEVSTIASATVDGGGSLSLGPLVTFSGALAIINGSADIACVPGSITARAGSTLTIESTGGTLASLDAEGGTNVNYLSNTTLTLLTLRTSSTFDKSGDLRALTITSSVIDGDSCTLNDPNSTITFTNATTVNGAVQSGPFQFTNRSVKLT